MSQESKLREEICRIGASLYQRGYTVGSAGNISARLDDGWLITPTDACLGQLDPDPADLAVAVAQRARQDERVHSRTPPDRVAYSV